MSGPTIVSLVFRSIAAGGQQKEQRMNTQLISRMNDLPQTGENAVSAARMCYLEWVFALPNGQNPKEAARDMLEVIADQSRVSDCTAQFSELMRQTLVTVVGAGQRRGGRSRMQILMN